MCINFTLKNTIKLFNLNQLVGMFKEVNLLSMRTSSMSTSVLVQFVNVHMSVCLNMFACVCVRLCMSACSYVRVCVRVCMCIYVCEAWCVCVGVR